MSRLTTLAHRLPPAPVLLGWLVVAHVLLKVALFPVVMSAPPHGDEQAYLNGSMALSNAIRDLFSFTSPDRAELDRNVVASGWFMPGMSIVVAPLYVVFPDAGPALVRGYCGIVTLALYVVALRSVVRVLGHRWAVALAVFPGLVPMWVYFGYGAWGDLNAGLVLLLVVLRLVEMFRTLRRGEAPTVRDGLVLGLLSVVTLYLRSSTSVLLAGLGVVALATAVVLLRGAPRWRAVGSAAVAGVVFLLLLAPWSAYASHVLDARVLTTTTVATSKANTFGDREQVCFGPCDPDSTLWFRPLRYAREVGRATGTSEVDVLKEMSAYARRDMTIHGYLDQVGHNLAAYSLQPAVFVDHVVPEDERGPAGSAAAWTVKVTTWLVYFPALLLVVAALLSVVRRSLEARLVDVLVKLCLGALLVQPFVHVAGGRYWTTAAPFFGLAAATFVVERLVRAGRLPAPATGVVTDGDRTVERWLNRIQVVLAAAVAIVAVAVLAAVVL
ncbi:hypothetical protein BJ993_002603 [Nocardioides aromaticivorans]|uniref:Glycosyltransferase RgtA/B/C/D-like domain-containing protein n=1 Tax=Nocardioides aromaticivorans TaxID=200618 RepID=A0A7Z0CNU0_9ACTN|nr:hypothetical protein [Nocardioides aromaticivorans]NYI45523.1 hypothetical protein [Nocardioides aromaticivorans]